MSVKMPIALQLYTLRSEAEKDFIGTLKKVAELGYKGVEFAGYGGLPADELRDALREFNLVPVNSHVAIERLEKDLDGEISYALGIGLKDITVPYLAENRRNSKEAWIAVARQLQDMGKRIKEAGLNLHYHNHAFEFQKFDGKYGLDILIDNTDADVVKLEVDTFWVQYAGVDPVDYLKGLSGRVTMVHLKDMIKGQEPPFAEVGEGCIDIAGIIRISREIGVQWGIVEQDVCQRPPLESVKLSIDNLRNMGVI
ncbi:sugar phosphate isomerase/epimerase [Caldicoprobacter algeriensis]|uniref:sugar phosphate isomerase/epimerase family protein n=1 Tax=Caldicoprobacter algeriensis TaxID=699281 RepID=UPI00207AF594|nr:sugar phosphate isomerase/epimerase [Caldicoprobacter algeriensis]MCM8901724.1 sugar phosphate isomerase/epimerase [Caldicoprobacter algeriensis]